MNSEDVVKLSISAYQFEERTKKIIKLIIEQWEVEDAYKYSIDHWLMEGAEIVDWDLSIPLEDREAIVNVSIEYSEQFEDWTYSDLISFPVSYYDSDWSFIQFKEGQRAKKWLEDREKGLLEALKEQVEELGYKMVKEGSDDARLIKASPKMYNLLEDIFEYLKTTKGHEPFYGEINDLLEEIRGES